MVVSQIQKHLIIKNYVISSFNLLHFFSESNDSLSSIIFSSLSFLCQSTNRFVWNFIKIQSEVSYVSFFPKKLLNVRRKSFFFENSDGIKSPGTLKEIKLDYETKETIEKARVWIWVKLYLKIYHKSEINPKVQSS